MDSVKTAVFLFAFLVGVFSIRCNESRTTGPTPTMDPVPLDSGPLSLTGPVAARVNIVPTMVWVRFDNAEAVRLRCYAYTKAGALIDGACNWTSRNTAIITVTTPAKVTTLRAKKPAGATWGETTVIAGRSGVRDSVKVRAVKLVRVILTPPQVYCVVGVMCDTVSVQ